MAQLSPRSRCQRLLAKGNELQALNVQMCADIEYLSSLPIRHSFQKPHIVPRKDSRPELRAALNSALAPMLAAPQPSAAGGASARAAVLEQKEKQLTAELAERKRRVEEYRDLSSMDLSENSDASEVRREALKWKQAFEALQKKNDSDPLPVRRPLGSSHFSNT
jgi:hypothetical protein